MNNCDRVRVLGVSHFELIELEISTTEFDLDLDLGHIRLEAGSEGVHFDPFGRLEFPLITLHLLSLSKM